MKTVNTCGHTERPHRAMGYCARCYYAPTGPGYAAQRRHNREWYRANAHIISAQNVPKTRKTKLAILHHYSNGTMTCGHCAYAHVDALFLDHINDDGAAQRRALYGGPYNSGHKFYLWLIAQGMPPGYQVLCANCNWLKEIARRRDARRARWSTPTQESML